MNDILKYLAVDGIDSDVVEPTEGSTDTLDGAEGTNSPEPTEETTEQSESVEDTINEIDIDGEKYTLDQIKSFKQNSITAQEYMTMKEEIARDRETNKDAIELFNYLKDKPELTKKLVEFDSSLEKTVKPSEISSEAERRIQDLELKIRREEIEKQLTSITSQDKDVNEIELLKVATENNVSVDIAYNIWKGQNFNKLKEKIISDTKKSITENLKKNNDITKTVIANGDKPNDKSATFGLTDIELKFAEKVGMSPEDYAKYKA